MRTRRTSAQEPSPAPPAGELSGKDYDRELKKLHVELVKLQAWVQKKGLKVCIVFEGRDGAGKGGTIKAITERVSPRVFRVIALPAPTEREKSQMYAQRYLPHLPAAGEIVIFDRSWYNRAGVERVMGFCSEKEARDVPQGSARRSSSIMVSSGIILLKYWLEVSPEEQERRLASRINDGRKTWKLSPMDVKSFDRWDDYTEARDEMFAASDTEFAPWYVARSEDKRRVRLNVINHILEHVPYKEWRPRRWSCPSERSAATHPPITRSSTCRTLLIRPSPSWSTQRRPRQSAEPVRPPLRLDLVAGLTAAAVVLPKAMAYATVAGLPVATGLYTAFLPVLIYAVLGSSRVLSVSSTTTLAILTGTQLGLSVPDGDPGRLLVATATLTALVGVLLLLARVLRLGFLANFISAPVLTGFKAGIGLVIVLDQVPKLLGVHITKAGFFRDVLERGCSRCRTPRCSPSRWQLATFVVLVGHRALPPALGRTAGRHGRRHRRLLVLRPR